MSRLKQKRYSINHHQVIMMKKKGKVRNFFSLLFSVIFVDSNENLSRRIVIDYVMQKSICNSSYLKISFFFSRVLVNLYGYFRFCSCALNFVHERRKVSSVQVTVQTGCSFYHPSILVFNLRYLYFSFTLWKTLKYVNE